MSNNHFLQLRSSAPGLPSPYLLENHAIYQWFDSLGNLKPAIVIAIGGRAKREWLMKYFNVVNAREEDHSIKLFALPDDFFWFDCELHIPTDPTLSKLKSGSLTDKSQAIVSSAARQTKEIALSLYSDILPYFSDVIVIFAADFGGLPGIIDLLCHWIHRSRDKGFVNSPRVVIIHDAKSGTEDISFELMAALASYFRHVDPIHSYSAYKIKEMIRRSFYITYSTSEHGESWVRQEIINSKNDRQANRTDFSAQHFRSFLQAAIQQFALEPWKVFSPILASRLKYSIPGFLLQSLLCFLSNCEDTDLAAIVLSSALVMNAFPPGMHHFSPGPVYDELYKDTFLRAEAKLRRFGLMELSRSNFVLVAQRNEALQLDSIQSHKETLHQHQQALMLFTSTGFCDFCILRPSRHTLRCKHRLCSFCVIVHGKESHRWCFSLQICPFCQLPAMMSFHLQAPTAGDRRLILGGKDATRTWQFLKDLQTYIGIEPGGLNGLFDHITASDTGIFLAITVFMEGWTLYDCKYHLDRLRRIKVRHNTISFGKRLAWEFDDIQCNNTATLILNMGKRTWSNRSTLQDNCRDPDICVRYDGGNYSKAHLAMVASRLLASLFYIELDEMPDFSSVAHYCRFSIHCRIEPGEILMNLLLHLKRKAIRLYTRGFEAYENWTCLCSDADLQRCEQNQAFVKIIYLQVLTEDTEAQFSIDGFDADRYFLSRCPYRIGDIIRDQEIDNVFGRNDRKSVPILRESFQEAESRLEQFLDSLS